MHPARLAEDELLKACKLAKGRSSGPGGQHRNKVETKVTITHEPTGVEAQAGERRSAEENRRVALRRLRLALAVKVRAEVPIGDTRSELWKSRCSPEGRVACNTEHQDYPALLADALDMIHACGLDLKKAAVRLCCSSSQLVKLIQQHPAAFEELNRQRERAGEHPLHEVAEAAGMGHNRGVAETPESSLYEAVPISARPGALPRPALPGSVVVRAGVEELIDAMAADLLFQSKACVRTFGDFHLALSGGSTPEPFYRRLMYDPNYRELPWKRTHLWLVDERRVPEDDDRCNFKMIHETIVAHSDIPREQVHPMNAMRADADEAYERELRDILGWREKGHDRLDFVLLGMGADGHTASLFPRSPALDASGRLVVINSGPTVTPPGRVTMTFELLNASRFVGVMVTGEKKKATVQRVVGAASTVSGSAAADLPILGIRPVGGELRWFLDAAACP